MNISHIQKLETGAKVHNLEVVIKKTKKRSQLGDETTQEFVLADNTGEILAEILLVHRSYGVETLIRNEPLTIIAGEIQQGADGTRLYVSEYERHTQSEPDEPHYTSAELEQDTRSDWDKTARGRTKCVVVCAAITSNQISLFDDPNDPDIQKAINKWVNYIFE
jgi:hypothetical protein